MDTITLHSILETVDTPSNICWIINELMLFGFLLCYLYCYFAGRNEYRRQRKEHLKFQKLRLACMLVVILDGFWPWQYIIKNMSQWYKTLVVIIASSVDVVIPICVGTICLRIFSCYYRIKCENVPSRFKIMLSIWYLSCVVICVLEVLRFAYTNNNFFGKIFFYFSIVWFSCETLTLLILSMFLYQLIRLLWNSYHNVSNNLLMKNRKRTESIVKRMTRLTMGFIFYLLGLLIAYIYYFIKGNNIQTHIFWIITHYIITHFILYCTFLSYVRPRRANQTSNLENVNDHHGTTQNKNKNKNKHKSKSPKINNNKNKHYRDKNHNNNSRHKNPNYNITKNNHHNNKNNNKRKYHSLQTPNRLSQTAENIDIMPHSMNHDDHLMPYPMQVNQSPTRNTTRTRTQDAGGHYSPKWTIDPGVSSMTNNETITSPGMISNQRRSTRSSHYKYNDRNNNNNNRNYIAYGHKFELENDNGSENSINNINIYNNQTQHKHPRRHNRNNNNNNHNNNHSQHYNTNHPNNYNHDNHQNENENDNDNLIHYDQYSLYNQNRHKTSAGGNGSIAGSTGASINTNSGTREVLAGLHRQVQGKASSSGYSLNPPVPIPGGGIKGRHGESNGNLSLGSSVNTLTTIQNEDTSIAQQSLLSSRLNSPYCLDNTQFSHSRNHVYYQNQLNQLNQFNQLNHANQLQSQIHQRQRDNNNNHHHHHHNITPRPTESDIDIDNGSERYNMDYNTVNTSYNLQYSVNDSENGNGNVNVTGNGNSNEILIQQQSASAVSVASIGVLEEARSIHYQDSGIYNNSVNEEIVPGSIEHPSNSITNTNQDEQGKHCQGAGVTVSSISSPLLTVTSLHNSQLSSVIARSVAEADRSLVHEIGPAPGSNYQ